MHKVMPANGVGYAVSISKRSLPIIVYTQHSTTTATTTNLFLINLLWVEAHNYSTEYRLQLY